MSPQMRIRIHGSVLAVSSAVSAVVLSGCALGPNYAPPAVPPASNGPFVSQQDGLTSPSAPQSRWWRLYDDPILDELVNQAFKNNDDLKAAASNLESALAILEGAKAERLPKTSTDVAATFGRPAVTNEILAVNGHEPKSDWLYSALFSASWEADLVGRVRRSIEAATDNAEASAALRDAIKAAVAAETARAYANICSLGEEYDVALESYRLANELVRITEDREHAGDASAFDVARARVTVARIQSSLAPLEGARRAALYELATLTGQPPASSPVGILECKSPPRLTTLIPIGDGAELLRRRPDVRAADRRFAAATAGIGIALADYFPRVELAGQLGGIAPRVGQLTSPAGLTWGIGPTISWSFPNFALVSSRVHAQRASADADLASFHSTLLQALKETEQAITVYAAEYNRNAALQSALTEANRAYELAQDQYAAGSVSYLDELGSEQTLIDTRSLLAASETALVQDQVSLFKALGGGWESDDEPAATQR